MPKNSLIAQTWNSCKSISHATRLSPSPSPPSSCPFPTPTAVPGGGTRKKSDDKRLHYSNTPTGCFSVYVGPEKERFVVAVEHAHHPLFRMLLDEAESEYGFTGGGRLELPCIVDLFYRVLAEMECNEENDDHKGALCGFRY
ncbi:hypothetical protein MLD38_040349 [Melastoma candidum]|uniref:Uncharacterized protein n=1 Tax=Melastoma candidum TaxID=119954 RepID=A0ACB9L5Q6_9MYRT|nr:hypothetical protein MLD38_040349 [Melastoma candidum]